MAEAQTELQATVIPGRVTAGTLGIGVAALSVLCSVPALVVINVLPAYAIAALAATALCAGVLLFEVLKQSMPRRLACRPEGLLVKAWLSQSIYPWSQVDTVKLIAGGGTFGDDPLATGKDRLAVGLFLKQAMPKRKTRGKGQSQSGQQQALAKIDPDRPDEILATAGAALAEKLLKFCEQAKQAKIASEGRGGSRSPVARIGGGQRAQFRRAAA